jgi:hypothetical protein
VFRSACWLRSLIRALQYVMDELRAHITSLSAFSGNPQVMSTMMLILVLF